MLLADARPPGHIGLPHLPMLANGPEGESSALEIHARRMNSSAYRALNR